MSIAEQKQQLAVETLTDMAQEHPAAYACGVTIPLDESSGITPQIDKLVIRHR